MTRLVYIDGSVIGMYFFGYGSYASAKGVLGVAIGKHPDPLLSQTLVASTYPLEIMQLQKWLEKNRGLKDKALTDAVMKQVGRHGHKTAGQDSGSN
jgi:hypothetical protein